MNAKTNIDFCWDNLLHYVSKKGVIPVIGEGLYRVRHKSGTPAGDFLLYPYLAETFTREMGLEPGQPGETFSQAVFRYQEKHPEKDTNIDVHDFLRQQWDDLEPVPDSALRKLARIKTMGLFINTTYDNYLLQTLKKIRSHPVETIHYTPITKWSTKPDDDLFKRLQKGKCSLIFNIYGNTEYRSAPAYTEKDIMETIVTFQRDIEIDTENRFLQELQLSNILFMGCGYDDWLFRFFIRSMYRTNPGKLWQPGNRPFIGDDFTSFRCGNLERFLKAHGAEVFYSPDNVAFVSELFHKTAEKYPGDIIGTGDFPSPAFISFHGADRAAAVQLAEHLREDGIDVWLDQRDLPPGARVDDTIIRAIAARPVFIAVVSENARQLQTETGTAVKYHIREWEHAYSQSTRKQNPKHIIPVVIDDTEWMYDSFRPIAYLKIPGGGRTGEYDKLRDRLKELTDQWDG